MKPASPPSISDIPGNGVVVRPSSPVLVFDSGVGGLTIAEEIAALLPGLPLLYVCDNGFFPYGTKPEDALVERVVSVLAGMAGRFSPALVVVACNTASTVALPRLRESLAPPIVGVVPAIKPAAGLSRNRVLGLLGTPGTIRRRYTQDLIERFAAGCTVLRVGSAEIAEMAERKLQGEAVDRDRLAAIVRPFFAPQSGEPADTIVLACTHFPLLREELAAVAPPGTGWVDSGAAVARRVQSLLPVRQGDIAVGHRAPPRRVVFTAPQQAGAARIAAFARYGFTALD